MSVPTEHEPVPVDRGAQGASPQASTSPTIPAPRRPEAPSPVQRSFRHRKPVLFWATVIGVPLAVLSIILILVVMLAMAKAAQTAGLAPTPQPSVSAQPDPTAAQGNQVPTATPAPVDPRTAAIKAAETKLSQWMTIPAQSLNDPGSRIFDHFNQAWNWSCRPNAPLSPQEVAPAVLADPSGPAAQVWAQCLLFDGTVPGAAAPPVGTPNQVHLLDLRDQQGFVTPMAVTIAWYPDPSGASGHWLITSLTKVSM